MRRLLRLALVFAPSREYGIMRGMKRHGSHQQLEAVRLKAVDLFHEGLETDEIATALDRSRRWVQLTLQTHRLKGGRGLAAKIPTGRQPKLTPQQRRQFLRQLNRPASKSGFLSDLWTAARVRELLRQDYGVEFHVRSIPRFLKACGYSYQKPQKRAVQRDDEEVERWLKVTFKQLKKNAPQTRNAGFSR